MRNPSSRMQAVNYDEFKAMRRFPAFDGLRAIAASMVFAFHFGGPKWAWTSGWIGVHLFFVLSGFLITTLLLREEERYQRVSLRGFYVRRLFRIMPVYLVVLAATYAVAHFNGTGSDVRKSLFYYLFLMNEFAPTNAFLHTWTIGIEQKFYLFWPVIAFTLMAGAFRRRIAVTAVAMIGLLALVPTPTAKVFPFWPIHYVVILTGCALAIVMHHPRGYALVRPLTHPVVATVVGIGFVVAHVYAMPLWPGDPDGNSESLLLAFAVAVTVLIPTLLSRGLPAKVLSLRPMAFIGERSYSLYLIQILAAQAAQGLVPAWRTHPGTKYLLVTLVIALIAADALYRWVEQPMINLGRRFVPKRRVPDAKPVTATDRAAESADPQPDPTPAGTAAPL